MKTLMAKDGLCFVISEIKMNKPGNIELSYI